MNEEKNFRVRVTTPTKGVVLTYWDLSTASRKFLEWCEKTTQGRVSLENIHNGFVINEVIFE